MAGLRPPAGDIGVARLEIGWAVALVAIFALLLAGFALLERLGLDVGGLPRLSAAAALALFLAAALLARGGRPADFYVADRRLTPLAGGLALAGVFAGLVLTGILAGGSVAGETLLAWLAGGGVGMAVLASLVAPGLRRLGGYTLGDFFAARFGAVQRALSAVVSLAASFLLFLAGVKVAALLFASIFGLRPEGSVAAAAAIAALSILPGGLRSLSLAQILQCLLVAVAALATTAFLTLQGAAPGAGLSPSLVAELSIGTEISPALSMLLFAAGVAAFAPMFGPALGAAAGKQARSMLLMGMVATCLLAAGGVLLADALAGAVGAAGAAELLADPIAAALSLSALPSVLSTLLTVAALAGVLSLAQAGLFAATSALSHDIWDEIVDRKGPAGRRMLVARVMVIALAAAAVWLAPKVTMAAPALLLWALALAASGNLAALLLGLWWSRCNRLGAVLGSAAGLAVAGWGLLHDLGLFPWSEPGVAAGAASAAAIGLVAAFVVTVSVSLMTPAPDPGVRALLAALRSGRTREMVRERPA